jgi:hypothetical protein
MIAMSESAWRKPIIRPGVVVKKAEAEVEADEFGLK